MSFPRFIVGAAVALVVALPAAARAQATVRTACNDGTTTSSMASNVCEGHGGMNKAKTTVLRRSPAAQQREAARVAQAGSPAASNKPRYEERRGWRWHRREEEKREAARHRVRCRDGRWENAHGKGKEVCKHHGGLAH
jgi:hypothetical protein